MAKPKELVKVDALLRTEASMKAVVRGLATDPFPVSEKELQEWYHLAPAQLLEQYFLDFHRDHPEPRPRPHYLQCQTPHRIKDDLCMGSPTPHPVFSTPSRPPSLPPSLTHSVFFLFPLALPFLRGTGDGRSAN